MAKNKIITIVVVFTIIAVELGIIAFTSIKLSAVLNFGFLFLVIMFYFFPKIDEKYFIGGFFFIYPLLPSLFGINLPFGLPVLKAHRISIFILILYLLRNGRFFKYYVNFFNTRLFNIPILLIFLSIIFSSFLSAAKVSTIYYAFSFILESVILSVVAFSVYPKRENIESLVNILVYSCLILCVFGLIEKVFGFRIFTIFGTYLGSNALEIDMRDNSIRVTASFEHSISYAAYMAMMIPLAMYKFRDNYMKFFSAIALLILTILSTQSRSGMLGTGIAFALYFIFVEKKKIGILLFASIPVLSIYFENIFDYLRELNPLTATDSARQASTSARVFQLRYYTELIQRNLLFGYGRQEAPPMMRDFHDGSGIIYHSSIDNFYLGYAFHYGLFGLFAWLYMMIAAIVKPVSLYGKSIKDEPLMLAIVISFIIFNAVNILVFLVDYHFLFWIFLGVVARLTTIKNDELNRQKALVDQ